MNDDVKRALADLVALERDRRLGYAYGDLHMDPDRAIEQGLEAFAELGGDPDELVWPKDQEILGLEVDE